MFYVYEWFIVETGEIIYVGKGTGNRYKVRKHNKFFDDMIQRNKCESRIVKEFESEKEAFLFEYDRINELKAKHQCVCNIRDGGKGGTIAWWTDDLRTKYAEHNVMKSEAQRQRMSKNNPMRNCEISEKVNSRKRIPIIIGEKEYPSVKAACEKYHVTPPTINSWCIKGETTNGEKCYYKNSPTNEIYECKNDGQKKKVIYKGVIYNSSSEMGRILGISQTTASRWCRQGRDSFGNTCKYCDDTRTLKDTHVKQKHIPIIVNGIWYPSKEYASRELGVSSFILTQYLNGKKHDSNYICEYGNQQPSRGNAKDCTPEGSETNR